MESLERIGNSVGILAKVQYVRVPCTNSLFPKKSRTLNVKTTTSAEISKHWGFEYTGKDSVYYIRCNAKGQVNWDIAPVYSACEIVELQTKKPVVIH